MKLVIGLIIFLFVISCSYQDGDYGATVGDCDEICTVYYVAQRKLMEDYEIYDRNFPNKEVRRTHVIRSLSGHKIKSWFYLINEKNDTSYVSFSCNVKLDTENELGYTVEDLEIKN